MDQNIDSSKIARIIAQYRGKYRVVCENKEFWAEVTGKTIYNANSQLDYPVVGDLVDISDLGYGKAIIQNILPRGNILQRKSAGKDDIQPIASNIDTAFIVQAVDRDFNLNRFERYLTIVEAAKIRPVLILNKCDLISPEELEEKTVLLESRFRDTPVIATNILAENGVDSLRNAIVPGRIYCFLGSSGVGKSSLINKLLGSELIKTKEISSQTKKGKHTTTHRELFVLEDGGMIIDNPGMREVGLADAKDGIISVFSEIEQLGQGCRFVDCTHQHEPGCKVLAAVGSGELASEKYDNYLKLNKESAYFAMTEVEKRQRDKRFGKMVKNVMKQKKGLKVIRKD